jgi:hypothetical protein
MRSLLIVAYLLCTTFGFHAAGAAEAPLSPLPEDGKAHRSAPVQVPFDLPSLQTKWKQRIGAVRAAGILPIIDIESSFNNKKLDLRALAQAMDENGIALIAYSEDPKKKLWSDAAARIVAADPWRFIPAGNGATDVWSGAPERFLAEMKKHLVPDGYPIMGEFEFRHYPSPRQYKRGEMDRDVDIPIDGPAGEALFTFAEESGLPFEIHYEIEDRLLPALEQMLTRHPKAKVIWCHLAQIRYSSRNTVYGPDYVRKLIERHPNLYFDVAFGGPDSIYPASHERHARVWDQSGHVKPEWIELIAQHPWRFLAAMDLGGDRQEQVLDKARELRRFLNDLPKDTREIVAYKAAWKLLFGEDLQ